MAYHLWFFYFRTLSPTSTRTTKKIVLPFPAIDGILLKNFEYRRVLHERIISYLKFAGKFCIVWRWICRRNLVIGLSWIFEGLAFEFSGATLSTIIAGAVITYGLAVSNNKTDEKTLLSVMYQ